MTGEPARAGESSVHVFGVRHHGPGSARSLARALAELAPDVVLLEAPADAQAVLGWVAHADLVPPVAVLATVVDQPERAVFLPFAAFSPEWVAMRWAHRAGVPVRAIDLPLAVSLAAASDPLELLGDAPPPDALRLLAAAAGDDDPERWWEDVVEHRGDGTAAFDAVAEAMSAVREGWVPPPSELRREAAMRQGIRRAMADGHQRIAVVCGAWHVPALAGPLGPARADAAVVRGLRRVKVSCTWVPWSHRRLAQDPHDGGLGYGAGVTSPGWYAHVFAHPGDDGVGRWFVHTASLLRSRGHLVSPDHVISGVRLADALASLRGRPRPGLAEVLDATGAVLGEGGTGPMALVRDELVVGDVLGEVPDDAPQAPLARDLVRQQRSLRMRPEALERVLELDLRTPLGRSRSHLLHRLLALGVPWGQPESGRGTAGTFRETWRLRWRPEHVVRLVARSALGTTVEAAAAANLREAADAATGLDEVVRVLERALLADLPVVIAPVSRSLATRAAGDPDLTRLLDALGPLARALRYGDVRATDTAALAEVLDGVVVRVVAGLVVACTGLDDGAAAAMADRLGVAQAALALVEHPSRHDQWPWALSRLGEDHRVHPMLQGRATRLLHDAGQLAPDAVAGRLGRALGPGSSTADAAWFVEGFLAGTGTVLLHDARLLGAVDEWLATMPAPAFDTTVVALRRTFGAFEPAERRRIGQVVAGRAGDAAPGVGTDVDPARLAAVLRTVRAMEGLAR